MYAVISSVDCFADRKTLYSNIEEPTPGKLSGIPAIRVSGWAFAPEYGPGRVTLVCGARTFTSESCHRLDVEDAFPGAGGTNSGFAAIIWQHELPPQFEITIWLNWKTHREVVGTITGEVRFQRQKPLDTAMPGMLLLSSLGRSGSTLLMGLLTKNSLIVGDPTFPFELPYVQHGANALQICGTSLIQQFPNPLDRFNDSLRQIRELLKLDSEDHRSQVIAGTWNAYCDGFYEFIKRYHAELCERAGKLGFPSDMYIVEKSFVGAPRGVLRRVVPRFKQIVLVRHPLDLLASYIAWDKKTGLANFTAGLEEDEATYLLRLRNYLEQLLADVKYCPQDTCLLHYEDVVENTKETMNNLFRWLEVDQETISSPATSATERTIHMTSANPDASIGRGKRDLPAKLRDMAMSCFKPLAEEMGYELT